MTDHGWNASAEAWLKSVGPRGDWSRMFVLDPVMMARIGSGRFSTALDVGCGEGRFCRLMAAENIAATGIDITPRLVEAACARDPHGQYHLGEAANLPCKDSSFELVVSYLSLIDIADFRGAISEMVRVLMPGGALLVANLRGPYTARTGNGWMFDEDRERSGFVTDNYLSEWHRQEEWDGISIRNYHRPLAAYMETYLGHRLQLTHFSEPEPIRRGDDKAESYMRAPYFNVMEWRKPA